MKKLLLLFLAFCIVLTTGCLNPTKQEGTSLTSNNSIEVQMSSEIESSSINSESNSMIPNKNPSVIELLSTCGYVNPLNALKMNSAIPNYDGLADLYALSSLKELKNKKSFATISTQEGGIFYLFFVYDNDVKLNCQTHYFYMNGSVAVSELQSLKVGDDLHDCLKRIDKENSSIYDKRTFINDYNNAVLVWTSDGLYAIEYERKNEIATVKEVSKISSNTYRYDDYAFELVF